MDSIIDFTNLSLAIPGDTPAAASGTSASLFSTPLSTGSGSTGGIGLVLVLDCITVVKLKRKRVHAEGISQIQEAIGFA